MTYKSTRLNWGNNDPADSKGKHLKSHGLESRKKLRQAMEKWLGLAGFGWNELRNAIPETMGSSVSKRTALAFVDRARRGTFRPTLRDLWELSRGLAWARDLHLKKSLGRPVSSTSANRVLCQLLYLLERSDSHPLDKRSLNKCNLSTSKEMIVAGTHPRAFKWRDLTDSFRGEQMLVGLLEQGDVQLPEFPQMHVHGGEEAIYVLNGHLEFYIQDKTSPRMIELNEGEAVVFQSTIPHMVRFCPEEMKERLQSYDPKKITSKAVVAYFYPRGFFRSKAKNTELRQRYTEMVPSNLHGTFVQSAVVQQLKHLRDSTGLITARDVAHECNLTASYVTRMEKGDISPHLESIEKMKNICFDLTWDDLLPAEPIRLSREFGHQQPAPDRKEHENGYGAVGLKFRSLCGGARTHIAIATIENCDHDLKPLELSELWLGSHTAQEAIIVTRGGFRLYWYPRGFEIFDHTSSFPSVSRECSVANLESKRRQLADRITKGEVDLLDVEIMGGVPIDKPVLDFVKANAVELSVDDVVYLDSSRIFHILAPTTSDCQATLFQWTPTTRQF